ncbi:MAG TPA: HD domain-containing phosphohydrolase [Dehalococcoidia bacterium]|nr:HD domain-containing phosphohydrolase [Dehalococcoidia bacterium]
MSFIAASLAEAMGLNSELRLAACYAGLLHDVGAVAAGAGLAAHVRGDERMVFASLPLLTPEEAAVGTSDSPEIVIERLVDHVIHGARAAQELSLPKEAIRAIASHHERWDGGGYPHGLRGEEIPVVGRLISLADQIEALIDQSSPLLARRNFHHWLGRLSGGEADPEAVEALRVLGNGDGFWLGLFSADLAVELGSLCARLREPRAMRLVPFCEGIAQLVDARFSFTLGVSSRVAQYAEAMGKACDFNETRLRQLRVAALLHDVGQLAVSERILAKPGILSVDELEILRLHPTYSREVAEGINGLEEVADWIAAHHERIDGKGYPEGRAGSEIPLEARILAVADAYASITSDRPHRAAVEGPDAHRRLKAAAGTQLDAGVVDLFLRQVVR